MSKFSSHYGLIYRAFESGASDKVFYLLQKDGSKFVFVAKRIKSPTSKNSINLDLGNIVNIKTVDNYNLPILTDSELKRENILLKKNFKFFFYSQFLFEVLDKFSEEKLSQKGLFDLIIETLKLIEANDFRRVIGIFLIKMLDITGNLPDLSVCVLTSEPLNSSSTYLSTEIGFTSTSVTDSKISSIAYKVIRYGLENKLSKLLSLKLNAFSELEINQIAINWIESYLGFELKSKKLIKDFYE